MRIGVIFGGRSGEHEVSVRSAKTVIEQINKDKYEVVPLAITKEGKWLNPLESAKFFTEETQKNFADSFEDYGEIKTGIVGDTSFKGLIKFGGNSESADILELDAVFSVLHGTYGEDGTIQGLLEMAGIPYVGCGVLASSCGMDKVVMKTLFRDAGLPLCRYVWFLRSEWEKASDEVIAQVENKIGYPCFVKPANLGSSVGISRATDENSLRKAIELAAEYDRKIIVEEALEMREIECAVLGNDEPRASLPGEYVIKDESKAFLDYQEKYAGTGNNEFVVPAFISEELTKKIQQMAVDAFKSIDGAGLARVDFFLRNDNGELIINEINTLPGLTDASGYPKMWAGSGLEFEQVIDSLITLALERYEDKARNKTSF